MTTPTGDHDPRSSTLYGMQYSPVRGWTAAAVNPLQPADNPSQTPRAAGHLTAATLVFNGRQELMNQEFDRPKGKHVLLAIFGVTVALAVLGAAPAAWSDSSSAAAKRPTKPLLKVTARIRIIEGGGSLKPLQVFFTPSVINVGKVIIVARNSDPESAHQLSINGVYSRWMGPGGGTSVMKVTFKRPGSYLVAVADGDGQTGGYGLLKVLK